MPNEPIVPNPSWKDYEYDSFMIREKEMNKSTQGVGSALQQGLQVTQFPDSSIDASSLKAGSLVGDFKIADGSISSRDYSKLGTGWKLNSDGTMSGITATAGPGGSNTQVQFNDSGVLSGNSGLTYNKITKFLNLETIGSSDLYGDIEVYAGTRSDANSSGGEIWIFGGNGGNNAFGGKLEFCSGSGGKDGGDITFTAGHGGSAVGDYGDSGDITFNTSIGEGINGSGGSIIFYPEYGVGTGDGGEFYMWLGDGGNNGNGGGFTVYCGHGHGHGDGGNIILEAGDNHNYTGMTNDGNGGDIDIWSGDASGTGRGGNIYIELGTGATNGRLNIKTLPTSSVGLSTGDIWNNGGVLNIV